ncbi:KH domain-containing, RNA-binding, signal transduction-associated protein 2-like isoform X2 [Diadema setosum]|uniref:KH domain-containing, RNA-binding, signal transduction-associated protein 2-like isoform X2 n=1 Tax=Diadema setosum TaxID=31175 RepID=UPI003B3B9682
MEVVEPKQEDTETLKELIAERECIDPSFVHATRLLNEEIKRVENGTEKKVDEAGDFKDNRVDAKLIDVSSGKPIKLCVKVAIPVKEHPKFNFVGKLLGPRGNSLKRLQEETGTKIAILGRGSMRDKQKEEKLREESSQKFAHLNEELHVQIEVLGSASDAYYRLAHSIGEVQKYLVPDPNDDIRQEQLRELAVISGSYTGPPPSVTGSRPGGGRVLLHRGGGPGGMGRGVWGGMHPMRAMGPPHPGRPGHMPGGPTRMGSPPGRGGMTRGHAPSRGTPTRGNSRGMSRAGFRGASSGPRMSAPSFGSQMEPTDEFYEGGYELYNQEYDNTNPGTGAYQEYGSGGDGYADPDYGGATETENWSTEGTPTQLKYPSAMQQKDTLRTHPYSRY